LRLLVLESIAGLPGTIAAGFRQFSSLRKLNPDDGFIHTLQEEAENERMHLFICLKVFKPTLLEMVLVRMSQFIMGPSLTLTYLFKPSAFHRFVGYLEEHACKT